MLNNIPKGWKESQLDSLINYCIGGDWGDESQLSSDYVAAKVIRATDFSNWDKSNGKNAQIRYLKTASIEKRELKDNDIVIEISGGSPEQPVGRSIIIDKDKQDEQIYVCSNFFRLLRVNENEILPSFLNYYFKLLYDTRIIEQYQSNSTNLRNLKFKQFLIQRVSYPKNLNEQQEIVQVLDTMSDIIRLREECILHAQDLIPALFQEMFGDVIQNKKNINKIKLGKIFILSSGKFLPAKEMDETGIYPVFGGNGINGYHNEYLFDEPKLCIGRVGIKCGCVHLTKPKSWITDNALYINKLLKPINVIYLKEALTQINLNQYAKRAAQPVISQSIIYNQYILEPPIELQEQFAAKVEEINSYIEEQQEELENAKNMFQSLLHHAFTGELTRHKFGGDANG